LISIYTYLSKYPDYCKAKRDHYGIVWKSTEAETTAIQTCKSIQSTADITYKGVTK